MCKVTNKYGADVFVHYRKDGKISLRLEFLPAPEVFEDIAASNIADIVKGAIDTAMRNSAKNRAKTRRCQAKITG
jgi:hypothetical protein